MKKRNPLAVVGLSIITLGIYDLYWLYVVKKELNEKTSIHTPTLWLLIIGPILIIISYIMIFAGQASLVSQAANPPTFGSTTASSGHIGAVSIAGLILVFVGWILTIVLSIIWIFKFSKAINEYTKGKMSTAVTFLIMYLIHVIGVALIQDTFNDMLDSPIAATDTPGGVPAYQTPQTMPPQPPAQSGEQVQAPAPQPPAETLAPPQEPVVSPPNEESPPADSQSPQPPTQPAA